MLGRSAFVFMQETHASPETIRRFLRSELPAEESASLIRHLLARCPECATASGQAAWTDRLPPLPALGRPVARRAYEQALHEVERSATARERELARQRALADEQWRELRRQPLSRQSWWILNDPRCATWGFCELLLRQTALLASREPGQAAELARLNLEAVQRLEASRYGGGPLADLEAQAWSALADARRLELDLDGAGEALARAREALGRGAGDRLEEARLLRIEAAVAEEQGESERVRDDLAWIVRVARRAGDRELEAGARFLQAKAAGQLDPERGIAQLSDLPTLLEGSDLWQGLGVRHFLIWFLNDAGRVRQAALLLAASRRLYRPFGCLRARVELRWLEGKIARGLGVPAESERAFEEIWPILSERRLQFRLTCLSLDLAEVYLERGKRHHVLPLVSGTLMAACG
jgi:hypothetical protein